jgi:hypothetical protein
MMWQKVGNATIVFMRCGSAEVDGKLSRAMYSRRPMPSRDDQQMGKAVL